MLTTIDRYLTREIVGRTAAATAVIVAVLTFENVGRLAGDAQHTAAPLVVLGRLSMLILPEHVGIGLPIGLLLGTMLTVRVLALRGEWQIFAAAGLSRRRLLLAPMLLATAVAALQLGLQFDWGPRSERALYALYGDVRLGGFGLRISVGEPVRLDDGTTLFASSIDQREPQQLTGILVRRGTGVFSARSGQLYARGDGTIVLELRDGVGVWPGAEKQGRRLRFDALRLSSSLAGIDFAHENAREGLRRLTLRPLLERMSGRSPGERASARAALAARVEAALFCLLMPCFGLVLGLPARRSRSGMGMAVAILLVVAHLHAAAFVEDYLAARAFLATALHFQLWIGLALGLLALERRLGEGFVERWVASVAAWVTRGDREQPRLATA